MSALTLNEHANPNANNRAKADAASTESSSNTNSSLNRPKLSNSINLTNQINSISQSVLFVNVKELNLKLYNDIIVSWNILEDTSINDWIGIYKISKFTFIPASIRLGKFTSDANTSYKNDFRTKMRKRSCFCTDLML